MSAASRLTIYSPYNMEGLGVITVLLNLLLRTSGDDWYHVCTVTTGGTESFYDLYMGDDTSVQTKHEALDSTLEVIQHYKSDLINSWEFLNIEQVKLTVNKDGVEKAFFIFNGTESTKADWFSKDRLLNTSYKDLTSSTYTNYFSIEGDENIHRRFFINKYYKGCPMDKGWLLILDNSINAPCTWEKYGRRTLEQQEILVLYCPLDVACVFEDYKENILADNAKIYIKFGPRITECKKDIVQTTFDSMTTHSATTTIISTSTNGDKNTLQDKIKELNKVLRVNPKQTGRYNRSLISVYENRISAVSMGALAISFISIIVGTIILLDLITYSKTIKNFIIHRYRSSRVDNKHET